MAKANQHVKKVTKRLLNASEQIDDLKSVGGSDGLFKAIANMGEKNLNYMEKIKSIEKLMITTESLDSDIHKNVIVNAKEYLLQNGTLTKNMMLSLNQIYTHYKKHAR